MKAQCYGDGHDLRWSASDCRAFECQTRPSKPLSRLSEMILSYPYPEFTAIILKYMIH